MLENQIEQNSSRIDREKEFHDQRFADDSIRSKKVGRFYRIAQSINSEYRQFLLQNSQNLSIIEYGCGTGSYAFSVAQNGAKMVTGIDISSVAIELAKEQAQKEEIENNISFIEMNAENLTFDDSSMDIICGSGILHHLDLKKAMNSINRVLNPNGTAIFIEPLGHNILINLFRRSTPAIRSDDEHPLREKDLELIKSYFNKAEIKYFYLTTLAASLFVGFPGFNILRNTLEFIDQLLFKLPFLQKQAWQVLIKLSEPIKD